jgi:hypothetical protein
METAASLSFGLARPGETRAARHRIKARQDPSWRDVRRRPFSEEGDAALSVQNGALISSSDQSLLVRRDFEFRDGQQLPFSVSI